MFKEIISMNSILSNLKKNIQKIFFKKQESNHIQESVQKLIDEVMSDENINKDCNLEIEILRNIISYRNLTVKNVMTPRIQIDGIDINSSKSEVINFIKETRHTRFPVFRKSLDYVVGYINVKDLFDPMINDVIDLKKLSRPIMVVPETMKVVSLLSEMRKKKIHISLVVDEYGGTEGIITIEDLIEEIIGEIEDEHDTIEQKYIIIDHSTVTANADLPIDEFEDIFNITINKEPDEDYNTIGGLILSVAGKVPTKGEVITYKQLFSCEILDSNPRKINKILIRKNNEQDI
jgi:magnesium and cobalt transporter